MAKKEKDGWDTLFDDDEFDEEGRIIGFAEKYNKPEPHDEPKKEGEGLKILRNLFDDVPDPKEPHDKPKRGRPKKTKKPVDNKKRYDSILNDVYNRVDTGINIAKKYGVSGAYISQIKAKFRHLKYKPEIKNGKLKCRLCDNQEDLIFHHDYKAEGYIDILCRGCELDGDENKYVVDPVKLLGQLYSIMITKMKIKGIFTESELKIVDLIGGILEK